MTTTFLQAFRRPHLLARREMSYTYPFDTVDGEKEMTSGRLACRWPRPSVAADIAVVAKRTSSAPTQLLLIQRKNPPFKGQWALPGGFVDENEPLKAAAERELQEETSIDPKNVDLFQVGSYGDPGRDPRGWAISVLYGAVVEAPDIGVQAADDASDARWFDIAHLPKLAFDHKVLVRDVIESIRQRSSQMGVLDADLDAALISETLRGT